jgi:hypothetical protein
MAMYSIQDLLNRWARGELTVEQATGQIIQHLFRLEQELKLLQQLAANLPPGQQPEVDD